MEDITVLGTGIFLIAQAAAEQEQQQEISPSGLIFLLPFIAFYTAVAIVYLSMIKRPVKVATVVVYVVCALAGAIGSMLAYTAVFTDDGDTDSTLVVLVGFAIAFGFSVLAGTVGVIALGKLVPRYKKQTPEEKETG